MKEVKMSVETKDEVSPAETGKIAYDVLMAKAEQLRKRFPTLTVAQAFEKVYTDRANADLVMAERRGNCPYAKDCALTDITAVAKAALSVVAPPVADRARLEPEDLGHYETGPSMTPGMRSDFPSTDEILRLVDAERKKGFPREKAIDIVASRLITGDAPQ
jgi:hypothetical protein